MAAADQQFLDALRYLGQSGHDYGIKNQMDQVNQRADEIRSTMTNEVDRRAALRELANKASISISGSGGNAQQAAAIQHLIPPIPTTVNQAYLQGSLTGDKQMMGVAQQMLNEDQKRHLALIDRKATIELKLSDAKEDKALARDAAKSGREEYAKLKDALGSGKALKTSLLDFQKAYRGGSYVGTGFLDQLTNRFTNQGAFIDQKGADILMAAKLQVAKLAGARSADTEGEQKAIASAQPNTSIFEGGNDKIIAPKVAALDAANRKLEASMYSLERSNFLSPTAYVADYQPRGNRTGVTIKAPLNAVRELFNKNGRK